MRLGVVLVEAGIPGVGVVTGTGVGVTGVGVGVTGAGVGVTAGVGGGAKLSVDTTTCAVGAVGLEPSHAQTKSPSRTDALIRVMSHAGATAIPRRVVTAEPQRLRLQYPRPRRSG